MVTRVFTKEKIINSQLRKDLLNFNLAKVNTDLIEELKEIPESKKQKRIIWENTMYKLYMLQNYNVTMDMFIGSDLRWSSINSYLTFIRAIYQNKLKDYKNLSLYKNLVEYIQGIMDSGTEPYSIPNESKNKKVTIQDLINKQILTKQQVDYIYSPISDKENLPDTSIAWVCGNVSKREDFNTTEHNQYYNIVEEDIENSSSTTGLCHTTNPFKNPFRFKFK